MLKMALYLTISREISIDTFNSVTSKTQEMEHRINP